VNEWKIFFFSFFLHRKTKRASRRGLSGFCVCHRCHGPHGPDGHSCLARGKNLGKGGGGRERRYRQEKRRKRERETEVGREGGKSVCVCVCVCVSRLSSGTFWGLCPLSVASRFFSAPHKADPTKKFTQHGRRSDAQSRDTHTRTHTHTHTHTHAHTLWTQKGDTSTKKHTPAPTRWQVTAEEPKQVQRDETWPWRKGSFPGDATMRRTRGHRTWPRESGKGR